MTRTDMLTAATEPDDPPYVECCEHEGCGADGNPCWLPTEAYMISLYDQTDLPDPDAWYCAQHAHAHGFCWSCGQFWAGVESFDFGNPTQLCDNCRSQYEDDTGEPWDADDSYFGDPGDDLPF